MLSKQVNYIYNNNDIYQVWVHQNINYVPTPVDEVHGPL